MSDAIPIHCRHCGEALDVYVPYEDQFCSEECFEQYKDEDAEEIKMNGTNGYLILTNPFAWSR